MDSLQDYLNIIGDQEEDNLIIIKEIFDWLILDIEDSQRNISLLDIIDVEFNIYKHY